MKRIRSFSFIALVVAAFISYGYLVYAAAPSGGYAPGATLDPDCAPGDTDCIVQASGGTSLSTYTEDSTSIIAPTASGINSVAIGSDTIASGANSVAVGFVNPSLFGGIAAPEASGTNSVAIGTGAVASGTFSIAMGLSTSSGLGSFGSGLQSTASGMGAAVFGSGTTASGDRSFAAGTSNTASGSDSVAFGQNNNATRTGSFAAGGSSVASGNFSFAAGGSALALSSFEAVFGRGNTSYTPSSATGWSSSDRLFTIGNGLGSGPESDAFMILKNGQIGIGIDNFEASADASALLTLGSTTQGFLMPRMTESERDAISSPATGLQIYNTDDDEFNFYDGSAWTVIGGGGGLSLATYAEDATSIVTPIASGTNSVAIGSDATASGAGSVAIGFDLAFGPGFSGPTASGAGSMAFGVQTLSSGIGSLAAGFATTASGNGSVALGTATTASADSSFAAGDQSIASGYGSISLGINAAASAYGSFAAGRQSAANGYSSVALGFATQALSGYETALGTFNTPYTPISTGSWTLGDRLLTVGNGTGSGTESDAFTILKSGLTGIGYDNFETTTETAVLQVNGSILQTGAASCSLTADTDGEIICTPSDQNLKQNIVTLASGLDLVNALRPVTYEFKDSAYGSGEQLGFIAQELQDVLPQVVTNGPGYKSVNYGLVTPVLAKAIQELDLKISDIEANISAEDSTFAQTLRGWFADAANGISEFVATTIRSQRVETDELCVGSVCVTEDQFMHVFNSYGSAQEYSGGEAPSDDAVQPVPDTGNDAETPAAETLVDESGVDAVLGDGSPSEGTTDASPDASAGNEGAVE